MEPYTHHNRQSVDAGKNALGIYTEFASAEVTNEVERITRKYYLQSLARELLPNERVNACMRIIAPHRSNVDLMRNPENKRTSYRGVIRCSSVWNCAVCSSAITEGRKRELESAIAITPHPAVMITYTLRHLQHEPLKAVMTKLYAAYRRMKSGRAAKRDKEEWRYVGYIRAFEITHGQNGWHPHFHELLFADGINQDMIPAFWNQYRKRWNEILKTVEGEGNEHALTVTNAEDHTVKEYVAKYGRLPTRPSWNIASEITKQPAKTGKSLTGRAPLQLLFDYGAGDEEAGRLFIEYAEAVKGRSQLQWSRGLKELLQIDEATDGELAEDYDDQYQVLTVLNADQWKTIRDYSLQAEVLAIATHGDPELVHKFLNDYRF